MDARRSHPRRRTGATVAAIAVGGALLALLFAWSWPVGLVLVLAVGVAVLAGSGTGPAPRPRTRPGRRRSGGIEVDVGWATSALDVARGAAASMVGGARRSVAAAVDAGAGPRGQRSEAVGVVVLSLLLTACAAGIVSYALIS